MQIHFTPELLNENAQIFNIANDRDKAIGYFAYIIEKKKVYIYGHLEDEGVYEDFKDLVKPFIKGLTKIYDDLEIYSYLSVGGKLVEIDESIS